MMGNQSASLGDQLGERQREPRGCAKRTKNPLKKAAPIDQQHSACDDEPASHICSGSQHQHWIPEQVENVFPRQAVNWVSSCAMLKRHVSADNVLTYRKFLENLKWNST